LSMTIYKLHPEYSGLKYDVLHEFDKSNSYDTVGDPAKRDQ